jgi:deoxyguanosine kinase
MTTQLGLNIYHSLFIITKVYIMFPYRFIAIEGNIGAGKTTLCEMLSADLNCHLILEQFSDNPFLPLFYNDPERYAFSVELFFMTERHKQLQESLTQPNLFHTVSLADYFFIKTLIFAKNNLTETEYRLFKRLFKVLNATFPKPDLLVFASPCQRFDVEYSKTRARV